jgi:hypothetical protein
VIVGDTAAREGFKPTLARVEEALEIDFSDTELESATKIIEISNSAPPPPPPVFSSTLFYFPLHALMNKIMIAT